MEPASRTSSHIFNFEKLREKDRKDIDLCLEAALPSLYPDANLFQARVQLILIASKIFRSMSNPKAIPGPKTFILNLDQMDGPQGVCCLPLLPALKILFATKGFDITDKDALSFQIKKLKFKANTLPPLFEKFKEMRALNRFIDVTLKVGSEEFKCHRFLLASRSNFFSKLFEEEKAKEQHEFPIAADIQIFNFIFNFIYTNKLAGIKEKVLLVKVMVQAKLWGIEDLATLCMDFLGQDMRTFDAINLYFLAKVYDLKVLLEISQNFIKRHSKYFERETSQTYLNAERELAWVLSICTSQPNLEKPESQLLFLYESGLDLQLSSIINGALTAIAGIMSKDNYETFLNKVVELQSKDQGKDLMLICQAFYQEHKAEITDEKILKILGKI